MPEGGKPYVSEIEIEGLPTFLDPLDGDTFDSVDEAREAGVRFATSQIDY